MSPLAKKLMKNFVKNSVIWTIMAPILMIFIGWLIKIINFQFIGFVSEEIYGKLMMFYHGLSRYPWIVVGLALLIWIIGEVILVINLMKKASNYVEIISDATEKMFDQHVEYIEMPEDLKATEERINNLKKESEENFKLAKEAEQRKNDLIVYLAHDLKTPLTSIIGYLSLLTEDKEIPNQDQKKYTNIALEKAYRLEDLINEFFEITKISFSKSKLAYTKVDLVLMIQQLSYEFTPMLKEKNLSCNIQGEPSLMVSCDPGKIQRVFDNILKNAVNYSFSGQAIDIIVEKNNGNAVVSFENKGNTISAEELEKIFEKFYRLDQSRGTKEGGAGLGLAISKEFIELHKGTIKAESKENTIRFTVELPLE